jgi:hypothetical protein
VYISTCGCVFSQAGLKTVSGVSSTPPKETSDPVKQFNICPQCSTKFDVGEDLVCLNPSPDEEEKMYAAMERRRALEPKKSKKRKGGGSSANADAEPPLKKQAPNTNTNTNPSVLTASRALASSLATEEAKRKAGMSEAVKSMYGSDKVKRKETFMTMGTFTRVSEYCVHEVELTLTFFTSMHDRSCSIVVYKIYLL